MSRFQLPTAFAALLSLGLAAPALAEGTYPRAVGSGENVEIEYGPGEPANIVGGGRVEVAGSGEDVRLRHLDPGNVQAPRRGLMPVIVGSGEGATTVWVPSDTDRTRLALIGTDGSLPAAPGKGEGALAGLHERQDSRS